ncbi:hypothetical protein [Chitinophaga nivalis]|uniref:DUF4397 domain-containing protein n=1 Tax=Chitinophaga nivalis TaxID=2991709 RepID=A0ABT3IIS4_9BACT|nr:hypothetical protein [Chitinophaga nivalis]MCW3466594.1 hypothetical protein [Chitinophaga nivalis]MCW3483715.1 hypothetical protein [Chitinophaga nivalis]
MDRDTMTNIIESLGGSPFLTFILKMKFYSFRFLCSIFFGLQLLACNKGELTEGEKFVALSVPFVFHNNDTLDLYVDGKLIQRLGTQQAGFGATLKQKDQLHISIHKKDSAASLKDTLVRALTDRISLTYAYDTSYGFNQFIKEGDFDQPAKDSIAFILINKFNNFGSGAINISIYRDNNMENLARSQDSVTTVKNISLNQTSVRIVLPANNENGQKNLYVVVVRDAVSGVNAFQSYITDYEKPDSYAFSYLNASSTEEAAPGMINVIKIESFLLDNGVKVYNLPKLIFAFQL